MWRFNRSIPSRIIQTIQRRSCRECLKIILAIFAAIATVCAPMAPLAFADRTALKPGVNVFSPEQDINLGKQNADQAEK